MTIINMTGGGAGGIEGSVVDFPFYSSTGIGNLNYKSGFIDTDNFVFVDDETAIARIDSGIYLLKINTSTIVSQTILCSAWSTTSYLNFLDAWKSDDAYFILYNDSAYTHKNSYVRRISEGTSTITETFPGSYYSGSAGMRIDDDNYIFSNGGSNGFSHMTRTDSGWDETTHMFGSQTSMYWSMDRNTVVFNGSSLHLKLNMTSYDTEAIPGWSSGSCIATSDEVYVSSTNGFLDSSGVNVGTIPIGSGMLNTDWEWSVDGVVIIDNMNLRGNVVNGYCFRSMSSERASAVVFTKGSPGNILSNNNTLYVFE